jgi:hypothetical protein
MRKKKEEAKPQIETVAATQPFMLETVASTTANTRRNLAGTIERTDRFKNIDDGLVPFRANSAYGSTSGFDCRDAIVLCQKCYYNFALFRNIIDLMTEFSVNNIYLRGGNEKSRKFFYSWLKKINDWDLQDKVFREWYRSGTVALWRDDALLETEEIMKLTHVYGEEGKTSEALPSKIKVPVRYSLLNPADITMSGAANFAFGNYHKQLTEFEVARLKHPKTEEDQEVFDSLPPAVQDLIRKGARSVIIPLDPNKVHFLFYKRQDYEPFGIPMGYPVLEAINAKAEMMKIDMAIARTMQQIILLVTNGNEPEKGGINQKNLEAFKALFANQSVGRVLIADYTTKAEFVVPEIGDLLDPKKYEVLEREISVGLNNVFSSDEKFANQAQKVELFVARLAHGRQAFLNNFLIPEIKRISKLLGFKVYPTPYFEDIELKDNLNYAKIYARLMELGILTPEQGLKAIESNTLPDFSMMEEAQQEFKRQRDKGLYEPLVGGAKEGEEGRPGGDGTPLTTKKVSPIGSKGSESEAEKYGISKVKENLILAQALEEKVVEAIKKKHNIKRLNKLQKEVAEQITHLIIANEEPTKWRESIDTYLDSPEDRNKERVNKVIEIAATHQVNPYIAGILLASKV